MKVFHFFSLFFLLFLLEVHADNTNVRPFTNIQILPGKDSITINGAILQIGNQILCKNNADFAQCEAPALGSPNNSNTQHFARIDTSVNHSNTMAKLVLQPSDEVIYARLYWSARVYNITDAELTTAKSIKIKGPNATSYTTVTAPDSKFNWWNTNDNIHSGIFDYGASAEVTDYVKAQGSGNYYVGDITAETGTTGIYASWQLIVVVKNGSRSLKNVAIYDGFQSIFNSNPYPSSVTVDASGFITPTGNDLFDAYLYIYAGETDTPYGDSSEIVDGNGNWVHLVDGANTPNDVMNASVYSPDYTGGYRYNEAGMANPNFQNVLGVDIDKLQINDKTDASKQILGNGQTSTQIKLTSTGDRYSLNMFAFETEVFVPNFCYDYAYKQQGRYFTESNDGTHAPHISGNVISGEPVEVTFYLKSLVEGSLQIQNMTINVDDINTTQATYIPNVSPDTYNTNTKVAKVGDVIAQDVTVTSGTSGGNDFIHDVPIGTLDQGEYFYLYYSLDPKKNSLDFPLTVSATYDLQLDTGGDPVGYTLRVNQEIPICTTSDFTYSPARGIFNIVHNDYYNYDTGGSNRYYNLPTQVTRREGNFKILSMDPNNLDNLQSTGTVVSVEMIDAAAFHDTNASCTEIASAISPKVWIILHDDVLDQNVTSIPFNQAKIADAIAKNMVEPVITNSSDFYAKARENTAFRVSYNLTNDGKDSLVSVTNGSQTNTYKINFTELVQNVSTCKRDMDNNEQSTDTVATYCGNNSDHLTAQEIATCMECLYGYNTRMVCSRDNFATRPEAFLVQLDDQNQTNPAQPQVDITTLNNSGLAGAIATPINLAAGYQYNIEVNATNHLNNNASSGYTKTFNLSDDIAQYIWNPVATKDVSGCNDESNISVEQFSGGSFRFLNGVIDRNTSLNNVGRYLLTLKDTTWTSVDSDPSYMGHHSGSYFTTTLDCRPNSSIVQNTNNPMNPANTTTLNGCEIHSSHHNTEQNIQYNDYNISFYPYKFDINGSNGVSPILPTVGINHQPANPLNNFFVYMSDINNTSDENMSYHLNGTIAALGENNSTLSNFVDKCYALPLTITIQTTNRDLNDTNGNHVEFRARFHDLNVTTNQAFTSLDINITDTAPTVSELSFDTNTSHFYKLSNGRINTSLNLNYDRNVTRTVNPKAITFLSYDVNCTVETSCFRNADLVSDKTPEMTKDLNTTIPIKFYYGRAHAGKQRYEDPTSGPITHNANIYEEIYCFGVECDKTLLPANGQHVDDIRWYQNADHNVNNDGNVTAIYEKGATQVVTSNLLNKTPPPSTVNLRYSGSLGYPYTTTMEINASGWLIHNEGEANATSNPFQVEFNQAGAGWSGKHETNTTTNTNGNVKTNRRTMW